MSPASPSPGIAHVLAMDVVGYSSLLLDEQARVIEALTGIVRETSRFRAAEASRSLLRLPAGDGMYLVFFDAVESPLECAVEIARALRDRPDIRLRMGVHSGPVRELRDVNDRPNLAGAGIDLAQRVMDAGDAGHILLSKRVADDLSPDPRWHPFLRELGAHEAKHGKRLELVNFVAPDAGNPDQPSRLVRAPPSRAAVAASRHAGDAVAVLPLENLSGRPDEEYLADGLTEALITDLAKIGGLKVISRGSVMGFKGRGLPLAQVGAALGVNAVVEGSVLRAGDRVRISARLVDVSTDEYLWAERYDREIADVLALQDEVARAVAQSVNRTLHPPPTAPRRVDPEAYLLDLRGRQALHLRTEAGFRRALALFQEAADRDPTYAPALVGIADASNMLANYGLVPARDVMARSLSAARRALELDDRSADAHRMLAFAHWQFAFDWRSALDEYALALALEPESAIVHYWLGAYLAVIGVFGRAHEHLAHAEALDPLSLVIPSVRGWAHYFARRHDDALPILEQVLRVDPDYHLALWFRGEALVELGRHDEGIADLARALALGGRTSRLLGYLGYAYGRAGRADEARACLTELDGRASTRHVPPYFRALVHAGLDDAERALDELERAYAQRDTMLRDLRADAQWDRLRAQPRFEALMRAMAYPDAASVEREAP